MNSVKIFITTRESKYFSNLCVSDFFLFIHFKELVCNLAFLESGTKEQQIHYRLISASTTNPIPSDQTLTCQQWWRRRDV